MSDALRIIPLGGLGEVGKNMTVYELGGEIIVASINARFLDLDGAGRDDPFGLFDFLVPPRQRVELLFGR